MRNGIMIKYCSVTKSGNYHQMVDKIEDVVNLDGYHTEKWTFRINDGLANLITKTIVKEGQNGIDNR